MKQATHAWIAIRAVGLLQNDPSTKGLFAILRPHIRNAALGSWMPDLADTKLGSGDIDNHVFKMAPFKLSADSYQLSARYVTPKADLLAALGPGRAMGAFIGADDTLDRHWWGSPYRADPLPCQDIPTRANALSTTLIDQLILGERGVTERMPRTFALSTQVTPDERTRAEQLALFFFMQSHFIADACMPCHCDARPVAAYAAKLHPQWEGLIEKTAEPVFSSHQLQPTVTRNFRRCGVTPPTADSLKPEPLLKAAKKLDAAFGLSFPTSIPEPRTSDPWKDTVAVCRASFAVASIVANPRQFPYTSQSASLSLADIKADQAEWERFEKATSAIVHDAVINVAMGWKRIWGRFGVQGARCEVRKGAERC